jgi:hypothetical protein
MYTPNKYKRQPSPAPPSQRPHALTDKTPEPDNPLYDSLLHHTPVVKKKIIQSPPKPLGKVLHFGSAKVQERLRISTGLPEQLPI